MAVFGITLTGSIGLLVVVMLTVDFAIIVTAVAALMSVLGLWE